MEIGWYTLKQLINPMTSEEASLLKVVEELLSLIERQDRQIDTLLEMNERLQTNKTEK